MFLGFLSATLGVTLVMLAGWLFQRRVGNAGWVDVFWSLGTGLICAAAALAAGPILWRRLLVAALLLTWSLRLGGHIAKRVASGPEDVRYAGMRAAGGANFQRQMFGLIILQGPFSGVLSLAVLFAARQPAPGLRLLDVAALLLALGAIAGESLADRQMQHFRANPQNKGKICEAGLWAWSRHPNYLCEFLSWCAYPLLAITPTNGWSLLSLLAPAIMYATLRYASGVPPLEAAMLASRGDAYRDYQSRVGAILPRLAKKLNVT